MLKWAVNGPRESYLQSVNGMNQNLVHVKSCNDLYTISQTATWKPKLHKHITTTPILTTFPDMKGNSTLKRSPNRTALKDSTDNSYLKSTIDHKTPELQKQKIPRLPPQYASTLPSFDEEYSPCGLIPGPILALRGLGIPDSYFEKPRYLAQDINDNYEHPIKDNLSPTKQTSKLKYSDGKYPMVNQVADDKLLEQMIAKLLESNTHKEKRSPKRWKYCTQQNTMSPTYTPADDPASDLHESWQSDPHQYQERYVHFVDEESCTPIPKQLLSFDDDYAKQAKLLQLRRQFSMRRKRRFTRITMGVKNSASKLCKLTERRHNTQLCKYRKERLKSVEYGIQRNALKNMLMMSPTSSDNGIPCDERQTPEQIIDLEVTKRKLDF